MSIAVWFACPGLPDARIRSMYEKVCAQHDADLRWIAIPGRSAAFTAEALRVKRVGLGSVINGLKLEHKELQTAVKDVLVCFSAGYGFAREVLKTTVDLHTLDGLVLLDSLHAGFDPDHTAADYQIQPFADYAHFAAEGVAVFYTGHTDVRTPQPPIPGAFASTTQAHQELLRLVGGMAGNFQVRRYDQFDPQHDKQEHAAALNAWGPALLDEALSRLTSTPADGCTTPVPPNTAPFALSYGGEALAAALRDLNAGVHEDLGHNDGTRIREYAKHFNLPGGINWCAVACSTWLLEAAAGLKVQPVVPGSPGAQALGAQFKDRKRWQEPAVARCAPGDVVVWRRPPSAWAGHTGLVESRTGDKLVTVEGNSGATGDRVARMERSLKDPLLLGFGMVDP